VKKASSQEKHILVALPCLSNKVARACNSQGKYLVFGSFDSPTCDAQLGLIGPKHENVVSQEKQGKTGNFV